MYIRTYLYMCKYVYLHVYIYVNIDIDIFYLYLYLSIYTYRVNPWSIALEHRKRPVVPTPVLDAN